MIELQDVVKDFLVESYENLDQLDRDLLSLEQDPKSQPTLGSIFRTIHTLKGTCGFFGFGKLECITHLGENLLSKLRDGELEMRPDMATGLLSLVDAIREILANIEAAGAEGEADHRMLVETLVRLQGNDIEGALALRPPLAAADKPAGEPGPTARQMSEQAAEQHESTTPGESRAGGVSDSTIRVEIELLDSLMHRVNELVLACNLISRISSASSDPELVGACEWLDGLTTDLQEVVMRTRMQPIGNVWSKFPRLVRDLALQCGKQVQVEMEGEETELDRTIVEAIKDPLTHLLRNAVDHGIEPAEERLSAGKPAQGVLRLRAEYESGQVNIELSDDGRGLDYARIRQKAVERGMISLDQAVTLSDHDAAQLVFAPGFSTAERITHLSGRGVGMDVVKTNIERIGGTVEIHSRVGAGCMVRLSIPLTLLVIPPLRDELQSS